MKQKTLNYGESNYDAQIHFLLKSSANYDHEKMRKGVAHWVLMPEHPLTIVEEFETCLGTKNLNEKKLKDLNYSNFYLWTKYQISKKFKN